MLPHLTVIAALALGFSAAATAQELPKQQFKVIGLNSPTPVHIYDEKPFWTETIPQASNSAITAKRLIPFLPVSTTCCVPRTDARGVAFSFE